jgi:hypothetical protein
VNAGGTAYSSTLKMEAICSSETSVEFQRTTRCNISEDGIQESNFSPLLEEIIFK